MILHSDGRIEGSPSEIAEYKIKLIERAERKELERIRNIPATMVRTDNGKIGCTGNELKQDYTEEEYQDYLNMKSL